MALVKIYRLACEGPALAARLRQHVTYTAHQQYSPLAESSVTARRAAIRKDWTRVTKSLPITRDPNGPTSDVKFDLCPSCTAQLKGN